MEGGDRAETLDQILIEIAYWKGHWTSPTMRSSVHLWPSSARNSAATGSGATRRLMRGYKCTSERRLSAHFPGSACTLTCIASPRPRPRPSSNLTVAPHWVVAEIDPPVRHVRPGPARNAWCALIRSATTVTSHDAPRALRCGAPATGDKPRPLVCISTWCILRLPPRGAVRGPRLRIPRATPRCPSLPAAQVLRNAIRDTECGKRGERFSGDSARGLLLPSALPRRYQGFHQLRPHGAGRQWSQVCRYSRPEEQ